jgi:hypothetical protein
LLTSLDFGPIFTYKIKCSVGIGDPLMINLVNAWEDNNIS